MSSVLFHHFPVFKIGRKRDNLIVCIALESPKVHSKQGLNLVTAKICNNNILYFQRIITKYLQWKIEIKIAKFSYFSENDVIILSCGN